MKSPAMNKLRRIDADLLTLYEWHSDPDGGTKVESAWPTLKKLSERLAEAVEEAEKEIKDSRDAKRWQVLFNPNVSFRQVGDKWMVYFRVDSRTVKLMDQGPDLVEIVDRCLDKKW